MLYALNDLGGSNTRREVIDHISRRRWYELIGEDLRPTATSSEARYRIDLAWARKDGVLIDLINNLERNSWELSRRGHDVLDRAIAAFRASKWDLRMCEYFSLQFKREIAPDFVPHPADKKRAPSLTCLLDW